MTIKIGTNSRLCSWLLTWYPDRWIVERRKITRRNLALAPSLFAALVLCIVTSITGQGLHQPPPPAPFPPRAPPRPPLPPASNCSFSLGWDAADLSGRPFTTIHEALTHLLSYGENTSPPASWSWSISAPFTTILGAPEPETLPLSACDVAMQIVSDQLGALPFVLAAGDVSCANAGSPPPPDVPAVVEAFQPVSAPPPSPPRPPPAPPAGRSDVAACGSGALQGFPQPQSFITLSLGTLSLLPPLAATPPAPDASAAAEPPSTRDQSAEPDPSPDTTSDATPEGESDPASTSTSTPDPTPAPSPDLDPSTHRRLLAAADGNPDSPSGPAFPDSPSAPTTPSGADVPESPFAPDAPPDAPTAALTDPNPGLDGAFSDPSSNPDGDNSDPATGPGAAPPAGNIVGDWGTRSGPSFSASPGSVAGADPDSDPGADAAASTMSELLEAAAAALAPWWLRFGYCTARPWVLAEGAAAAATGTPMVVVTIQVPSDVAAEAAPSSAAPVNRTMDGCVAIAARVVLSLTTAATVTGDSGGGGGGGGSGGSGGGAGGGVVDPTPYDAAWQQQNVSTDTNATSSAARWAAELRSHVWPLESGIMTAAQQLAEDILRQQRKELSTSPAPTTPAFPSPIAGAGSSVNGQPQSSASPASASSPASSAASSSGSPRATKGGTSSLSLVEVVIAAGVGGVTLVAVVAALTAAVVARKRKAKINQQRKYEEGTNPEDEGSGGVRTRSAAAGGEEEGGAGLPAGPTNSAAPSPPLPPPPSAAPPAAPLRSLRKPQSMRPVAPPLPFSAHPHMAYREAQLPASYSWSDLTGPFSPSFGDTSARHAATGLAPPPPPPQPATNTTIMQPPEAPQPAQLPRRKPRLSPTPQRPRKQPLRALSPTEAALSAQLQTHPPSRQSPLLTRGALAPARDGWTSDDDLVRHRQQSKNQRQGERRLLGSAGPSVSGARSGTNERLMLPPMPPPQQQAAAMAMAVSPASAAPGRTVSAPAHGSPGGASGSGAAQSGLRRTGWPTEALGIDTAATRRTVGAGAYGGVGTP